MRFPAGQESYTQQPSQITALNPFFRQYKPTMVLLPASRINLVGSLNYTFGNDATVRNGAFEFPGVSGYIDIGSSNYFTDKNAYTVVVVSMCDALPDTYGVLFSLAHTSGRTTCFYSTDTVSYRNLQFGDAGTPNNTGWNMPTGRTVTGMRHQLVLRKQGSGASTAHDAWLNGIYLPRLSTASFGTPTGNSVLGNATTSATTQELDGRIWLFAIFDSIIPDPICQELSRNPWSLFSYSSLLSRIPPTTVAAPASTFIPRIFYY